MIERYTLPDMARLWSDQEKLNIWTIVEGAAAVAKGAPPEVQCDLANTDPPTPQEVQAEERVTRHDVVAFLNVWRRDMDPETAGWVHRGMTSSDLVDTANSIRLVRAANLVQIALKDLHSRLVRHAYDHWNTPRIGRTHGQVAEATTWGYRIADLAVALDRASDNLNFATWAVSSAKLSGPVGNYTHSTVAEERKFAELLGLNPALIATQIVSRDRYCYWITALATIASIVEALATEIRLSAHHQVGEVSEGFAPGQAGSSAMPHKQNPIVSEQLCGLARLVRAQVVPIMEGVASWHERDISHSSTERVALQTASTLTHYMLKTATDLVTNLVVHKEVMAANLDSARDATLSAWIKDSLIALGIHPETAWSVVREAASIPHPDLVRQVNMVLHQRGYDLTVYPPEPPQADTDHVYAYLRSVVLRDDRQMTITLIRESDPSDPNRWVDIIDLLKGGDLGWTTLS